MTIQKSTRLKLKYHKIRNVDMQVCTVEQKIAYNLALRYRHIVKSQLDKCPTGIQKAEIIQQAVNLSAVDTERANGKWYIGWDYDHYGDYTSNPYINMFGIYRECEKRWTTEEIVAECKNVINQIVDKEGM